MNLTYYPFLKKMSTTFEIDPSSMNFTKASELYDTIIVDKNLGRSLPSAFSDDDFNNLKHLHNWFNHLKVSHNLSRAFSSAKL
jgi:hypothetical protein